MKKSEYIFESLLKKTLEETTSKAVEIGAGNLLGNIIPVLFVSPVVTVIASVSKEFIKALLDKTKTIESKIDKLLNGPFETGIDQLADVIGFVPTNEDEKVLRSNKLTHANEQLSEAYNLVKEEHKIFVRAFQSISHAITPGGEQFYSKYLNEVKEHRDHLIKYSGLCDKKAGEIGTSLRGGEFSSPGMGKIMHGAIRYKEQAALYEESQQAKKYAEALTTFIVYVEEIKKLNL